jgi:quinol monooxygenase YgiN
MSGPIVYIDRSEIREGKLEEVKAAIRELVDFVAANEPQLLSYHFHINGGGTRMIVVAVHPDSASLEFHMDVAGPVFRKFTRLIDLTAIEVYGDVSDAARKRLQEKAQMLGRGAALAHEPFAGFARFARH